MTINSLLAEPHGLKVQTVEVLPGPILVAMLGGLSWSHPDIQWLAAKWQ